eukprot:447286-Rhodomonas_salina.1
MAPSSICAASSLPRSPLALPALFSAPRAPSHSLRPPPPPPQVGTLLDLSTSTSATMRSTPPPAYALPMRCPVTRSLRASYAISGTYIPHPPTRASLCPLATLFSPSLVPPLLAFPPHSELSLHVPLTFEPPSQKDTDLSSHALQTGIEEREWGFVPDEQSGAGERMGARLRSLTFASIVRQETGRSQSTPR